MLFASQRLKRLFIASALPVLMASPVSSFTFNDDRDGAVAHPLVVARYGGVYSNPALGDIVEQVATQLARTTPAAISHWTVTILDNPEISAFAHPGGYIYLNRGLLIFAESEAELAAALAQQMAHLELKHVERALAPDGAVDAAAPGALLDGLIGGEVGLDGHVGPVDANRAIFRAVHSAEEQAEAAVRAVAILKRAGYPASAALSLAERLQAHAALGRPEDENVSLFGKTEESRDAAIVAIEDAVGLTTMSSPDEGEVAYLSSLQGMTFGPSERQGFVDGNRYLHPELGIAFTAPDGFRLTHDATQVVAEGPGGARLILDTTGDAGSRLQSYLRDRWAPALTRDVEAGYLYDLRALRIGGIEAATAFQPYEDEAGAKVAQIAVLRTDDRDYRFRAVAPVEAFEESLAMEDAIASFRRMTPAESAVQTSSWVQIHRVGEGETINLLSATLPESIGSEAQFRLLNGYGPGEVPLTGDLVKLVMEGL